MVNVAERITHPEEVVIPLSPKPSDIKFPQTNTVIWSIIKPEMKNAAKTSDHLRELQRSKLSPGKNLHLFDMDSMLHPSESLNETIKIAAERVFGIGDPQVEEVMNAVNSACDDCQKKGSGFYQSVTARFEAAAHVGVFVTKNDLDTYNETYPVGSDELKSAIQVAKESGDTLAVISGGYEEVAKKVMEYYGIEHGIYNKLKWNEEKTHVVGFEIEADTGNPEIQNEKMAVGNKAGAALQYIQSLNKEFEVITMSGDGMGDLNVVPKLSAQLLNTKAEFLGMGAYGVRSDVADVAPNYFYTENQYAQNFRALYK